MIFYKDHTHSYWILSTFRWIFFSNVISREVNKDRMEWKRGVRISSDKMMFSLTLERHTLCNGNFFPPNPSYRFLLYIFLLFLFFFFFWSSLNFRFNLCWGEKAMKRSLFCIRDVISHFVLQWPSSLFSLSFPPPLSLSYCCLCILVMIFWRVRRQRFLIVSTTGTLSCLDSYIHWRTVPSLPFFLQ